MPSVNLFPAVLLGGSPHSGKSVLAYLLSQRLRDLGIAHYLLRAVPDGEGDWYLEGNPNLARILRLHTKVGYTEGFVRRMQEAIQHRMLPLLVDIGGKPQGKQFSILNSCTHSVLLYKTDEELVYWQQILSKMNLLPVAELRSSLEGTDSITTQKPVLQGVITGLQRDPEQRKAGIVLDILVDRIAGICQYEEPYLEWVHSRGAIYPLASERELALKLGVPCAGSRSIWEPAHLERLQDILPAGQSLSIYGRGPVWLAAALAVRALPAPVTLFDVRYGWIPISGIRTPERAETEDVPDLKVQIKWIEGLGEWIRLQLPQGWIEPGTAAVPVPPGSGGAVISGALPRWLFAALARQLAPEREWVGIDDPRAERIVVIHSHIATVRVGETIPRPEIEK